LSPGAPLARAYSCRGGFCDHRSKQADAAHSRFRSDPGVYEAHRIPTPIVAEYLRENRIVPEKNDLNSLLFLITPGVESSKAWTLLSALVAFSKLHDENARLIDAIPEFVRARPARYAGVRLRDLCGHMHDFYRSCGVSKLQKAQFMPEHLPEMAMTPQEAVRQMVRNKVDYLPLDKLRPDRYNAVRRLSPRHSDHRAWREHRRACVAHA
jgi:arginine/lysine/ornithine decarboxylase